MKSARGLVCLCLVATLVLASVGLAGCGKSSENKPEGNEGSKPLKAALISGPVSDAGWNAAGYDGLKAVEKELGATVSNTEVNAPAEYEEAIRSYASQGFDVIFAHGFQFQDAAKKVAAEYPNTAIIVVSGTEPSGSNMSPMIFLEEQGFYVMGLVAAKMTKTNRIGLIGGMQIPALEYPNKGFKLGVQQTKPECKVVESWIGTWDDVGKAKEAALAHMDAGADVVFGSADQATLGVLQACAERGVWTFGAYSHQIQIAPQVIIGEFMLDMRNAFIEVARQVKEKTFKGGVIAVGLKDKALSFTWNDQIKDKIPAEVRQAGDQALADIASGKIVIPEYSLGKE